MRVFYMTTEKKDIYTTRGIEVRIYPDQDCPEYRMADVITCKGTYKMYEIGISGHFVYRSHSKGMGLMFSLNGVRSQNELLFGSIDDVDSFESVVSAAHAERLGVDDGKYTLDEL